MKKIVAGFVLLTGFVGWAAFSAPVLAEFIALVENGPKKTKKDVRCYHFGAHFLGGDDKLAAARLMDEAVGAATRDGGAYLTRVVRERLSVDHYMLLNYDALRSIAARNGLPWTRPATRAEAVEKWIADVKAAGVRAVRETTDAQNMRKYFDKLRKAPKK